MSETFLRVGKRGEIFTNKELRKRVRIRVGGRVRAKVVDGSLIVEPLPSIEDMIQNPMLDVKVGEAEKLSEEAQQEEGAYG